MAPPRVDKEYREEIEKARTELHNLTTSKEKFSAPDLLRLAYASQFSIANFHHDAAAGSTTSTDATTTTTQSAKNNNLIGQIRDNHRIITYPDLYQLAGVVAVKALEGPEIEFVPGREDWNISPDFSCLPDVKQSSLNLREVFGKVGISEPKHIVALCGGLNLAARTGVQVSTSKFDNSYFKNLNEQQGSSSTDNALLVNQDFRVCVLRYATDNEAFINDYKEAHKKLSEFGLPESPYKRFQRSTNFVNNPVTQRAVVGVAVAAAVVILGVFYLINRRRAKHSSPQF